MPEPKQLSVLEAFERYAPLGPDFLTWLCVHVIENDKPVDRDGNPMEWTIKGPVVLEGPSGEATRVSLAGELAAESAELRSALREGKKLVRARLVLTEGADTYEFTFNAQTFDLGSVKLPIPRTEDGDQFFNDRIVAMQGLQEKIDALFEDFLALRLSPPNWKKEAKRWRSLAAEE